MADQDYCAPSASETKKEDWMNSKWRPMMGWMYMLVCTMDFVGFPVLWSLLQMISHGNVSSQWQPLTLQGAGLFHIAMGAVIGISAYGRTQEKLGGAAGPTMSFPQGAGTTYVPPGQGMVNVSNQPNMGSGMGGGFGGSSSGFGGASNGGFGSSTGGSSAFGAPSSGGFGASTGGFGSPTTPAPAAGGFGSSTGTGTGTFGASTTPAPAAGGFGGGFNSGCGTTTPATSAPALNAKGQKVVPTDPDPIL